MKRLCLKTTANSPWQTIKHTINQTTIKHTINQTWGTSVWFRHTSPDKLTPFLSVNTTFLPVKYRFRSISEQLILSMHIHTVILKRVQQIACSPALTKIHYICITNFVERSQPLALLNTPLFSLVTIQYLFLSKRKALKCYITFCLWHRAT